jgi:dihydropyrimidinase
VFGGTTTTLSFAAQMKGQSLRKVVDDYHALAASKAVIDYGFHLIVSDPTEQTMNEHLPALIKEGMTSFKVYMTYDSLKLDDHQMLDVLATARQHGAMVMIHAENHDMIRWLTQRLLQGGYDAPKFHAISHVELAEDEATHRAIRLSELIDVPILIVHVSASEAMAEIRRAQTAGLKVYGETCPQYLFLTASDLDREGAEGAKYCCSPPPRDASHHDIIWQGLANGTFQVFSSDHAPYRFDETGKLAAGPNPTFPQVANGVPGIELRLPLLFSEGVGKGRIDIQQFVALTSTNVAKIYGLLPRKGTIAVGSDADIAIWDPDLEVTVTWDLLHDNVGYTPYEGRKLRGWPVTVLSRGRVAVEDGELKVERGSGQFLSRYLSDAAQPLNRLVPEMDVNRNFGAKIL